MIVEYIPLLILISGTVMESVFHMKIKQNPLTQALMNMPPYRAARHNAKPLSPILKRETTQ